MFLFDFGSPNIIALIIEADAHIPMVGVDGSRLLVDVTRPVALTTPTDILTTTAYPFASRADVWQYAPRPIITDSHDGDTTTACVIWSCLWSVHEVLRGGTSHLALSAFRHPLAPPLALVVWSVTF